MTSHDMQLALARAVVGDRVTFAEEKRPYTIQARTSRFLVCTKPFNLLRTVLYTIIDVKEMVRGPENLVFGMGAETREQCEKMLDRLQGRRTGGQGATEVSRRNQIPLRVVKVEKPVARGVTVP